jgi:dihydrofolate synthase/folylpolyglutamate synthase
VKTVVPVVIGPMPPDATEAIERRAKALRAPLWKPGRELMREFRAGTWTLATPGGTLRDVELGLRGEHQGANALVALGILHRLREQGFLVPDEAIRAGFRKTQLPGRLEELRPGLLVDGAHNEDGARILAAWLAKQPRPGSRILLFGMGEGRDPGKFLAPLLPHVDEVVTTHCAHPKARDSAELATALSALEITLSDGGPIDEILPEIYREADETVVTGSLFLVGAARSLVSQGALAGITPGQGAPEEEAEES